MNFLQITADTLPQLSQVAGSAVTDTETMNLWDLAVKGGWIMIVLLLLSILACYIFVERVLFYNKASKSNPSFIEKTRDYIREGKLESAKDLCESENTPGARMISKGIDRLGRPTDEIMAAIENVGNLEVQRLEKSLPLLATVASGAPMIGFLGTVTGMIRAFYNMAQAGANVDVSLLSSGIYEALVTTVGGLIVGILALFAYNYLTTRVDKIVSKSESEALDFMDLLNEPTVTSARKGGIH